MNYGSFAYLILILSLHYFVKFKSSCLTAYNNEFMLNSSCINSEMINWIATNTKVIYNIIYYIIYIAPKSYKRIISGRKASIISQNVTRVTSYFYHSMCLKCSPPAWTQAHRRWRDSPAARSITAWLRAAHSLLMPFLRNRFKWFCSLCDFLSQSMSYPKLFKKF